MDNNMFRDYKDIAMISSSWLLTIIENKISKTMET